MSEFANLRAHAPAIVTALCVGIPAGYLFDYLHTPIPWMIGPMIAVGSLNLMRAGLRSVPYGRQMGQVILGSAVSLYFTPLVLGALAANIAPIVVSTLCAFVIGGLGALILSRVSGVDGKTTFFASIPGGAGPALRRPGAGRRRRPQPQGVDRRHYRALRADLRRRVA